MAYLVSLRRVVVACSLHNSRGNKRRPGAVLSHDMSSSPAQSGRPSCAIATRDLHVFMGFQTLMASNPLETLSSLGTTTGCNRRETILGIRENQESTSARLRITRSVSPSNSSIALWDIVDGNIEKMALKEAIRIVFFVGAEWARYNPPGNGIKWRYAMMSSVTKRYVASVSCRQK